MFDIQFVSTLLALRHQAVQSNAPAAVKEAIDLQLRIAVGAAESAKLLTLVANNETSAD